MPANRPLIVHASQDEVQPGDVLIRRHKAERWIARLRAYLGARSVSGAYQRGFYSSVGG